jgi:hypothetical protein
VPDGSAIAKAIDYSLNHWQALSEFLTDGAVLVDNNPIENQMRGPGRWVVKIGCSWAASWQASVPQW